MLFYHAWNDVWGEKTVFVVCSNLFAVVISQTDGAVSPMKDSSFKDNYIYGFIWKILTLFLPWNHLYPTFPTTKSSQYGFSLSDTPPQTRKWQWVWLGSDQGGAHWLCTSQGTMERCGWQNIPQDSIPLRNFPPLNLNQPLNNMEQSHV